MNKKVIQKWFEKNTGGAILLPDGWFGRPFDNLHTLVSVDEKDNCLQINLDDGDTHLTFHGRCVVKADKKELYFYDFSLFVFSWIPYGTPKQDVISSKSYTGGEVVCVSN